jgi:hypothetical protein
VSLAVSMASLHLSSTPLPLLFFTLRLAEKYIDACSHLPPCI